MKWMPETKLGKISFWLVMAGIALLYMPYWIAMAFQIRAPIPFGFVSIMLLVIFGTTSFISIIKKDRAFVLFISALFGLFGILMVVGEFIFPHQ
ncbi:MAG: hypothetical protein ABIH34_01095 [Nanoarchaeota archaeon]